MKIGWLSVPFFALVVGCETLQTPQQRHSADLRARTAMLHAEEQARRLQGRLEAVEEENARLSRDVATLRTRLTAVERRSVDTEASVRSLAAKQTRDKQEIVDRVSSRVGSLLAKQRPAAPARPAGREHVVESGHTLSAIAKAYGTTVEKIKKANRLKSDQIYVGQKLFIPE